MDCGFSFGMQGMAPTNGRQVDSEGAGNPICFPPSLFPGFRQVCGTKVSKLIAKVFKHGAIFGARFNIRGRLPDWRALEIARRCRERLRRWIDWS